MGTRRWDGLRGGPSRVALLLLLVLAGRVEELLGGVGDFDREQSSGLALQGRSGNMAPRRGGIMMAAAADADLEGFDDEDEPENSPQIKLKPVAQQIHVADEKPKGRKGEEDSGASDEGDKWDEDEFEGFDRKVGRLGQRLRESSKSEDMRRPTVATGELMILMSIQRFSIAA